MKPMHRLILLSSAYRQASIAGRMPPRAIRIPTIGCCGNSAAQRLEAEEIRDAMLAVAGQLNPKTGGPSVIVPIDPDLVQALYKPSQWAVTPKIPSEHNRRSIYLFAQAQLAPARSWKFSTRRICR